MTRESTAVPSTPENQSSQLGLYMRIENDSSHLYIEYLPPQDASKSAEEEIRTAAVTKFFDILQSHGHAREIAESTDSTERKFSINLEQYLVTILSLSTQIKREVQLALNEDPDRLRYLSIMRECVDQLDAEILPAFIDISVCSSKIEELTFFILPKCRSPLLHLMEDLTRNRNTDPKEWMAPPRIQQFIREQNLIKSFHSSHIGMYIETALPSDIHPSEFFDAIDS